MSKPKNVKNLIMNVLPDNRPITSLQIVEDHEKYVFLYIINIFTIFVEKKTMFRMSIKWCNIRDLHFQMSEKFHARSSDSRSRLGRGPMERNKYFWKTNDTLFMLIKERRSSRIHCRYVKVSIQLINLI